MKKGIYLLAMMVLAAAALGSVKSAKAQDQPYRMSDREMKELVKSIDADAGRFRHSLHEEMEHARWDDRRDRESMNRAASDFERATDRLKGHFHDGNARPADVQEVLDRGAAIDSLIVGRHLLPRAKEDWIALRGDLDRLAGAYNISWKWPAAPPSDGPQGS
jgi:hypothetical protein